MRCCRRRKRKLIGGNRTRRPPPPPLPVIVCWCRWGWLETRIQGAQGAVLNLSRWACREITRKSGGALRGETAAGEAGLHRRSKRGRQLVRVLPCPSFSSHSAVQPSGADVARLPDLSVLRGGASCHAACLPVPHQEPEAANPSHLICLPRLHDCLLLPQPSSGRGSHVFANTSFLPAHFFAKLRLSASSGGVSQEGGARRFRSAAAAAYPTKNSRLAISDPPFNVLSPTCRAPPSWLLMGFKRPLRSPTCWQPC